ncbi:MAG: ankyrin repeat domain-containing protein [Alphaproteobacteria bacterium]|nr:ankyrin repeat domain-containing protein [Alphaproteobacteria bacterium]
MTLLEHGRPSKDATNQAYAWFSAVTTADWNTMRSLHDGGLPIDVSHPLRQTTALMEATRQRRAKVVEWLLHHGASPVLLAGTRATTALHIALKMEHLQIADRLLLASPSAASCDYAGHTTLHLLCANIMTEPRQISLATKIAEIILMKGCHIDALDNEGISALHYCVINGLYALAKLLLNHGANPNIMSPESKVTPLTIAALERQRDMVELLIHYGANPNICTQDGKSPLELMPEIQQWVAQPASQMN